MFYHFNNHIGLFTVFNNMMLMNKHSNGNQQQPQTQLATPENFLLFIQLAQIFGFQVDFAQKKAVGFEEFHLLTRKILQNKNSKSIQK